DGSFHFARWWFVSHEGNISSHAMSRQRRPAIDRPSAAHSEAKRPWSSHSVTRSMPSIIARRLSRHWHAARPPLVGLVEPDAPAPYLVGVLGRSHVDLGAAHARVPQVVAHLPEVARLARVVDAG